MLAVIGALALPAAILAAPVAVASTTPPTNMNIDGNVPDNSLNQINLPDLFGNVKELGPKNSNTTKIGVIHNAALPMLDTTNPNSQVDLRQAWLNSGKDTTQDDWIYFAWERDANNGSGFISFEFMKNAAPTACKFDGSVSDATLISTCNPWKNRASGDFLILWDQSGSSKDLFLRVWSGSGSNLTLGPAVQIPTTYGKAAYSADGFRGEAAINITQTINGGVHSCLSFANIIPSTVTGNSDTADYKDTILTSGVTLGSCTSTTVTTPKLADGTTTVPAGGVSITTAGVVQVKDSAVVDITGGTATPGGSVAFSLCKVDSPGLCGSGGTSIGSTPLSGAAYPVTVVSPSAWVTAAGRYCWRATFSGDPATGIGGSSDSRASECFTVNPVTPVLTTTAGANVVLGSPITDTASLTGTAPQPTPAIIEITAPAPASRTAAAGTITFTLFGPSASGCGSQITAATQSVTVSGDKSNYGPASYTPTTAGTYHWKASYTGDSPNTTGASHNANCTVGAEDVTIGPASTTTVTTPRAGGTPITAPVPVGTSVTDHAVVTGTAFGGSPTGTVDFFVCNPTQVANNGGDCSSGGTPAGSNKTLTPGVSPTSTADSDAVVANIVGTWCFRAVYTPDTPNYSGSGDSSTGECFGVKKFSPSIVTHATDSVTVGQAISDTATLSGATTDASGTITFKLYPTDACTAGSEIFTDSRPVSGNGDYGPVTYTPANTGTYYWIASYGGDAKNEPATGHCGDLNEVSTVIQAGPAIVTHASGPVTVGAAISDSATLSGGVGPTGTITFRLYSDDQCTNQVFTNTVSVNGNGTYPTSASYTTTAAGTYYWVASYSGDGNNAAASGSCRDANEASVVNKASPAIVTVATDSVIIDSNIHDTATLSGGFNPTGTITFKLFDNATCTLPAVFTDTVTVSGNGAYTSKDYKPTAVGTYYWIASYSGDANNDPISGHCGDNNESSTVNKAPASATTAQSLRPQDSIHVTASAGGDPTGTVTFKLFGPNNATCDPGGAAAVYTESGVPLNAASSAVTNNNSFSILSANASKYRWLVSYSGDATHLGITGVCGDENFTLSIDNGGTITSP
ncbi:hypothetical protein GCM10027053_21730 [Intrasporangium mesophilum]